MKKLKADVLVIGGGSGGLSVAAGAAQMGASVILLEANEMGGDCLNFGCVPSKALIATGKAAYVQAHAAEFGVSNVIPQVDYAAAKDQVAAVIARIAPVDSQERFEGLGVRVIREYGHFISPAEVQAGEHTITARRIVIATGSAPFVPPIPGIDKVPYETNESIFQLREKPGHLLIIGGGPIGMEMAQAHRRMGCEVTVIEGMNILRNDDPELVDVVRQQFRTEGISIAEDALAAEVRGRPGAIEVEVKDGRVFQGTHLLMAVGRRPRLDRLNLAAAGVETTNRGVKVDASLRSSNRRVYAIGDAAGGMQFTHVTGYHASLFIRQALFGLPTRERRDHVSWVTFTDPELAHIGLTEAQAREHHGGNLEVVRFSFEHADRAIVERKTAGFVKLMVVRGRPVGVSIVGAQAGELINFWALAISNRMTMKQLSNVIAPYPTWGDINKRVIGHYFSPRLFANPWVKRVVRFVQRWLP